MKIKKREGEKTSKRKKREGEPTKKKKKRALRVDDEEYDYNDDYEEEDDQDVAFNLKTELKDLIVEALEERNYNIAETVSVLTSTIDFIVTEYEDD